MLTSFPSFQFPQTSPAHSLELDRRPKCQPRHWPGPGQSIFPTLDLNRSPLRPCPLNRMLEIDKVLSAFPFHAPYSCVPSPPCIHDVYIIRQRRCQSFFTPFRNASLTGGQQGARAGLILPRVSAWRSIDKVRQTSLESISGRLAGYGSRHSASKGCATETLRVIRPSSRGHPILFLSRGKTKKFIFCKNSKLENRSDFTKDEFFRFPS